MTPRLLRVAALIEVLALVPAVLFVFLGATVHTCLGGGTNCGQPVMVVPPIRTNEGMAASLAICAVAWLAANAVIVAHLVQVDRPRLVRLVLGIALFAIALAAIGFLNGLQVRLRYAAEGAISWGLAGVAIGWVIGVAWAGLHSRPAATLRSMGRP